MDKTALDTSRTSQDPLCLNILLLGRMIHYGETTRRSFNPLSSIYLVLTVFKLIILIRHAQSEGNSTLSLYNSPNSKGVGSLLRLENREIHQTVPDHRVKLTPDGWKQVSFSSKTLFRRD